MATTYVKQTAKTGFWYSEGTQKSQIPDTSKEANYMSPFVWMLIVALVAILYEGTLGNGDW